MFADIVFPAAVRRTFTYRLDESHREKAVPGIRVWVSLRNRMTIGMIVRVHDCKPAFSTKKIEKLLDEQPVMSGELLDLTEWMHRFYYSGWGEIIQAALPAGLNFISEAYLRLNGSQIPDNLNTGKEVVTAIMESDAGSYPLREAQRRWGETGMKTINRLVKQQIISIWEEPRLKTAIKMETWCRWMDGVSASKLKSLYEQYNGKKRPKWVRVIPELENMSLPVRRSILLENENISDYTLGKLESEGLIECMKKPAGEVGPDYEFNPSKIKHLNAEQQKAYEQIAASLQKNEFANYLIYGVTGSGKTEVYIHALKKALELNKGALVLVPEIALTPQTVRRFYQIFGDDIAVLHSRLNDRERSEAWRALHKGRKKIAIGARSAVFAPVRNPGLIMIDEEHDPSYKQEDPAPRYHARDVAIMRAWQNKAVIVMGSATPSMVSMNMVSGKKARLIQLPSRHAVSELPAVKVLDLKQYRAAMRGPLAVPLFMSIEKALSGNEQVILLYNRRGFASFMHCRKCGQIAECPHCSVTLTYHKVNNQLRCHYCGYSSPRHTHCRHCHTGETEEKGAGTQKIEEELSELFPEARILRMDQDTTSGKYDHARILNKFGAGEADILVGTQVVAKGLDFPNVTVVGVINSDTELAFPSYRSGERMFQMLSQVSGRSGRGQKPGIVYLQTYQPDHPAIKAASAHDYRGFAQQEMKFRKQLLYPPFSRLLKFQYKSSDPQKVAMAAGLFTECLTKQAPSLPVLGPSPSAVYRVYKQFIWESYVKLPVQYGATAIEKLLDSTFEAYESRQKSGLSQVRITVNVDAI